MELQSMYAEYEYRRRIAASVPSQEKARTTIWRRIMG
jgi:hypothetical protein